MTKEAIRKTIDTFQEENIPIFQFNKLLEEQETYKDRLMSYKGKAFYGNIVSCDDLDLYMRKELGLPTRKNLVYIDIHDNYKKYEAGFYTIKTVYDTWCTLTLVLFDEDGERSDHEPVDIHIAFFREMQSPSFVKDYEAQNTEEDK